MRVRRFRWSTAVGAAAVAAMSGLAAGCSPASAGPGPETAPPEKTNVVVDDYPTIDSAGLYIAQMDGLFRQQGLDVTIRFTPYSQLAVNSVLNGTSDIATADYVTFILNELNNKAHLHIIAEASSLQQGNMAMLVAPHSKISSLA